MYDFALLSLQKRNFALLIGYSPITSSTLVH